jgi:ankyrin repeat protein
MLPIMTDELRWHLLLTKVTRCKIFCKARATCCFRDSVPGYHPICRELLAHGANVNLENLQGQSPLGWAAEQGHVEVRRRRVSRISGYLANFFCLFSSEQAVQVLLEYGAKDAGSTGWHCILLAAERGHTQV